MRKETLDGERIFVVHDFLSPEECRRHIRFSEDQGYTDAPITTLGGQIVRKDIRDNMRLMVDDVGLAQHWFERVRPLLPEQIAGCELFGMNERFRFYRYDVGQTFRRHYDGSFRRNAAEESQLSFMVYLNDDFTGGTTDFVSERGACWLRVEPRCGMALVFEHFNLHEGTAPTSGRKYVLRTDVMYRTPPRSAV